MIVAPPRHRAGGRVKVRDVLSRLRLGGWGIVATRGSHRRFKHPTKPGRMTVSGHPGDEMPKGTLASVLRQAGISKESA